MSKFTTVVHIKNHPQQYLVPRLSVRETAKQLYEAMASGKGFEIYDMEDENEGVSVYVPHWALDQVYLLSRIDLKKLAEEQEKANAQKKLSIAPN